jgi:hypothetical protein
MKGKETQMKEHFFSFYFLLSILASNAKDVANLSKRTKSGIERRKKSFQIKANAEKITDENNISPIFSNYQCKRKSLSERD